MKTLQDQHLAIKPSDNVRDMSIEKLTECSEVPDKYRRHQTFGLQNVEWSVDKIIVWQNCLLSGLYIYLCP